MIDPVVFKSEVDGLAKFNLDLKSKLIISRKAHLILPTHRLLDAASEASKGKAKIGSTLKGIGPTYMTKPAETEFGLAILNCPISKKDIELWRTNTKP